jgi:abl interactor 2
MITSSLLSKHQQPTTSAPVVPSTSSFGAKKNSFAPPPVHRKEPEPEPEPEPEQEEEQAQGEWAEALYDYEPAVSQAFLRVI